VGLATLLPVTSAAAEASKGASSPALDDIRVDTLTGLTSESFSEQMDSTFRVQVSALNVQSLKLVGVSESSRSAHGTAFDVVFLGQKGQAFDQGTYVVQHGKMGSFPLFLVPVGKAANGVYYQAIFSRLSSRKRA
jgi:hypothetical protein